MRTLNLTLGSPADPVPVTFYQPAAIADFHSSVRRPLVILLPGGGYEFRSDRENEIVAMQYLAQGFAVAVVAYRLRDQPPVLPTALYQLGHVVADFHRRASFYGIAADHILLVGFSAGGHLAALYADLWPQLAATLQLPAKRLKVAALTLAYPVIGLRLGWPADRAALAAITAGWADHEADLLVTPQNPPTFLWATADDELVPVVNAEQYAAALVAAGVPVTKLIYPHGRHGLSLARAVTAFPIKFDATDPAFGEQFIRPDVAGWFDQQLQWLDKLWHLDNFWRQQ
ncbi:alpha/beta hydrolase [Levilactobacillus enshiensis]|uniref:alpha/beta hydrolase n=1 Tax=Levilactobacillus enshiensis TaxID=2590213 RepID=UPI00117A3C89|nr:alpha/beta hydrolase [Levilactobacillus enshiensis]